MNTKQTKPKSDEDNDKNKDNSQSGVKLALTPPHRMMMLLLFFLQIALFVGFSIMMIHYTTVPLPQIFSTPSLMQSPHSETSFVLNSVLYASFFIQHIVMALIGFKIRLQLVWLYYPLY
jgi:quinol-cytochrome oxidoreductase complex cytochrome b subunit